MPHFSAFAKETPDRPAYILANSGEVVTYRELDLRSNQIAQLLRACGVQRGDHVAMMMKNCAEFLQVAQGALRAGVIFTPISTHLKQDETAYIITNCKAKVFFASASLAPVATAAADAAAGLGRCFSVGGEIAGFESLEVQLEQLSDAPIQTSFSARPCCTHPVPPASPRAFTGSRTRIASMLIIPCPAALALFSGLE